METFRVPQSHIKVKLPSAKQPKNFSCGASALRAIAVHFGVGPNNEQFYIDKCKTTPEDGTHPQEIIRVARELGLTTRAKSNMTIKNLQAYLDEGIPVICSIQAWGDQDKYTKDNHSGHYVVAIGYTKDKIYFMDPSIKGHRGFLPNDEFLERWHDKPADGDELIRFGIAVWSPKEVKLQHLHKVKKIK
jgi:predicted double-glycine peptidase